jgi:hypothetical protein
MTRTIHPTRVNHLNVVLEDFDASIALFEKAYGAEFLSDIPQAEWHAALVGVGRCIFEFFVPPSFLLCSRYGPHFLGVEYQADMDETREVLAARGIRIARDVGVAVHTHPHDTLGVAFEFFGGEFHSKVWPRLGRTMHPAEFWRDSHPLGMTGPIGFAIAVHDLDSAVRFLSDFLAGEVVYERERPELGARVAGLRVADAIIELRAAVSPGLLSDIVARQGEGMCAATFGVSDASAARRHLRDHGLDLHPASSTETLIVSPESNLGLLFEFAEV